MPRPATKVAQVHPPRVGCSCQAHGQVQRLFEIWPHDGGLLTHVAKNCDLGPRGDQRVGDSIDPDSGAPAVAAFLAGDSLEREDAVRTRELAKAQSHHAGVGCHVAILALSIDLVPWLTAPVGAASDRDTSPRAGHRDLPMSELHYRRCGVARMGRWRR